MSGFKPLDLNHCAVLCDYILLFLLKHLHFINFNWFISLHINLNELGIVTITVSVLLIKINANLHNLFSR